MKTASAIMRLLAPVALAFLSSCGTAPTASTAGTVPAATHETAPLQLIQKIPAPGVSGRIDHFTAFPKRRLLIFAALGNNTVEVLNTFQAKVVQSIRGWTNLRAYS